MGVYIPHIQMPDSCSNCFYCKHCRTLKRWLSQSEVEKYAGERHEKCPLVEVPEPHGRLVEFIEVQGVECDDDGTTEISLGDLLDAYHAMKNSRTVIEAEGD